MDPSGLNDEACINLLLDTLKDHKSIKHLSLHIRNIRPTDQKETSLMKSLQEHGFISRLCISSSLISREFTEALIYASKEQSTLTYLEFYNCKVKTDDKAEMQSLYDNGSLPHLAFYSEPRWNVLLKETNGSLNRDCERTWEMLKND
ncbi:unnamed protein product [Rotaria socialis]|uniref:Uncharacterized protein n=1 Tax=Rotaria socialis TaxID=392032 RepID=A0A821FCT1_9BILA|nr:unnamed protein product [Rotaria socialis]